MGFNYNPHISGGVPDFIPDIYTANNRLGPLFHCSMGLEKINKYSPNDGLLVVNPTRSQSVKKKNT